jgi:hypothetical protein
MESVVVYERGSVSDASGMIWIWLQLTAVVGVMHVGAPPPIVANK